MIWNLCIRRPVLTLVLLFATAIFGVFGYFQMPVREIPDVEFPIISVDVVLAGAEPEVIEAEILEPLETEINTVEGLKELTSTAREQVGIIVAEFELERNIDVAAQDVRDAVQRVLRELPAEIEAPVVRKIDPDASPIMWVTLRGDERWDDVQLSEFARRELKERLENVRGVGQVLVGGERAYAVRVKLDPDAMVAHGVTTQEVVDAIARENVDIPAGRVESTTRELLVKTRGRFASAEPLNDIVVTWGEAGPVRVRDVGRAVDGVENARRIARFSGQTAVGLGVIRQSDANTVEVAELVRERLDELAPDFPGGLQWAIATDESVFVRDNLRDLWMTVVVATILVMVVVALFLRSLRGTLITSLAIPTSLLIGIAVTSALGFSLNTLTMLAFILAIGIVIDDAIVVLESCHRQIELGAESAPAARTGTTEVAFAAIANSLSLAAVFIPIAFTEGLIGRFFFEFGVTVTVTVLASTLVALTLTPMLCSRLLRPPSRGRLAQRAEAGIEMLERGFRWLSVRAFAARWTTVGIGLLAAVLGGLLFTRLSTEFLPPVDREGFMIAFEAPEGATMGETDAYARRIEDVLAQVPEVQHQFMAVGLAQAGPGQVNEGMAFVHLTPRGTRASHQSEVMQRVRDLLLEIPDGTAQVLERSGPGAGQGGPIQIVLQGTDLDQLDRQKDIVMSWMRAQPELVGVHADLELSTPQLHLDIDRDLASELGLSVTDISNTLRLLLGEPTISEVERDAERRDVISQIEGAGEMAPADLARIHLRSREGELVPLSNVATWREAIGPSEIHHFDRLRSVTVSASPRQGVPLGDALSEVERFLEDRPEIDYRVRGQAREFEESFRFLALAVMLSVVFVFLVLAAQFESFVHPFTVMLAVPLAAVGAAGALWVLGMTLNIYSFIGLIMLLGMATKNAILLIDYTNILVARGEDPHAAAKRAAHVRFRPVVMTTMSTVLGILPIAIGIGAGGEARMPLGVSVAAGLLATTFLTLLVIPVVYTLIDDARRWVMHEIRKRRGGPGGTPDT
jgi:multidrug efflux pump